ncbi:TPA: hypothetical protein SLG40_003886 [Serratia odorifera]|nr:hypothetical protein [Serratia odorifera]
MTILKGILASESGFDLTLQVLKSGRGFYIGTANNDGPVSRESEEYFRTHEQAAQALQSHAWKQRDCL